MKRILLPALYSALLLVTACSKDPVNNSHTLIASKTNGIGKGEPVLFTFPNNPDTVLWKVNPANAQVVSTGSIASVKFASGGTYVVTATSGNATDSAAVHVEDSVYTPPPSATILPFSSGEQIIITASRLDSGSYSGLILYAHTQNSYTCFTNYLLSDFTQTADAYTIGFTGVSVPGGCVTGIATAGTFEYLIPVTDGTHPLTIMLNGASYTGTVIKTGSSYTINWSYTSGVIISPATL